MINLKTSVLLAASLKMGAILGGAGERNQNLIYEFGRKLGLAFQVQDDYLDAFGDPEKFGKQVGGDIRANKKFFDDPCIRNGVFSAKKFFYLPRYRRLLVYQIFPDRQMHQR